MRALMRKRGVAHSWQDKGQSPSSTRKHRLQHRPQHRPKVKRKVKSKRLPLHRLLLKHRPKVKRKVHRLLLKRKKVKLKRKIKHPPHQMQPVRQSLIQPLNDHGGLV